MLWRHPLNNWQLKDTTSNLVPTYSVSPLKCSVFAVVPYSIVPCTILCLGHFYFTKLLLPTLLATAKISPDGKVRIVNTSSLGHMFCSGIDFNTFKDGPARKRKGRQLLYIQSKLVRFLSPTLNQYSCNHREMSMYQMNLPIDMEIRASFLPLLTREILQRTYIDISTYLDMSS